MCCAGRVVDPVGLYPDPTLEKKLDPDPTTKKSRILPNSDLIKFTFYFFFRRHSQYNWKKYINIRIWANLYTESNIEKKRIALVVFFSLFRYTIESRGVDFKIWIGIDRANL